MMLARLEDITAWYRKHLWAYRNWVKRSATIKNKDNKELSGSVNADLTASSMCYGETKLDPDRIPHDIRVEFDDEGNVKYPIEVTGTLKILNLGYVDHERSNFHSARNIFPIGYKSIREYHSMFDPTIRSNYICEIMDGGSTPLFKVTPEEDPENPITKDASSGVWIEICKRINEASGTKRDRVTVSGPDRFGLSEPAVTRLISILPNADKCIKFRTVGLANNKEKS